MKFAFSSNAFRKYSLIETIRVLAELGYQGVEIMADVPHAYPSDLKKNDIEKIAKTLVDYRLEISNLKIRRFFMLVWSFRLSI